VAAPVEVHPHADFGDAALVARLKAGDGRAYEEVIRELGGRMLATAVRMLGNEDDAQEAVQDAFLSAFRNIRNFDEKSRFGTWIHRILINACLMKLRTRRRKPASSLDELAGRISDGNHSEFPIASWREKHPDDLDDETRARVQEEVQHLSDEHRTIIMLRDIEELNTEETATVLGISTSAVKTRLHRARLALRERLSKYFVEHADGNSNAEARP
jgi:RNA polymerase sigma-70 factor (ECF subfamily)